MFGDSARQFLFAALCAVAYLAFVLSASLFLVNLLRSG
jgi:hypothetical protein